LLLSLVENVAREQLSPVEEARAYAMLMDEFGLSLREMAEKVGRSKPSVSNRLRLLELPEEVLWMLARGELTEGHAKAILSVPDDEQRKLLARRVVRGGMSVRATERAARRMGAARKTRRARARVNPLLAERAAKAVEQLTGFRAKVTSSRIEVAFGDETELEEIVEALERASG
jgi:ParB family chromosome partitioning protein